MSQHSKDRLADELHKIGLDEMADMAMRGFYHDYESQIPKLRLNFDLLDASISGNKQANELRLRYINGEFNLTREEIDEWARGNTKK